MKIQYAPENNLELGDNSKWLKENPFISFGKRPCAVPGI